jgi:hypothetical protein
VAFRGCSENLPKAANAGGKLRKIGTAKTEIQELRSTLCPSKGEHLGRNPTDATSAGTGRGIRPTFAELSEVAKIQLGVIFIR